jgi:hypothetical protein
MQIRNELNLMASLNGLGQLSINDALASQNANTTLVIG